MSDTPRCDDALRQTAAKFTLGPQHVLIVELARQLERELAEARKDAERYQTARRMNVPQWKDAYLLNIKTGKPFDEIIDDLRPFMAPPAP